MTRPVRLVASVGPQSGPLKTRHSIGLPGGPQKLLPFPQLVVIEASPDGTYLFRYTAAGEDCGDTWHESIEDAKEQAEFEYGDALGQWHDVPSRVDDPVRYAHSAGLVPRSEA